MNAKVNIAKLKTNRKIKVFIVFLILSAIFWFFSTLSEKYTFLTVYNIKYTNIPVDLVFQDIPTKTIQAQIRASGFKILGHKLKTKSLSIDVSKFSKEGNFKYFYLPNTEIPILQQQLSETELIRFTKERIYISLGVLKSKTIPVKSLVKLQFKPGYKLTQNVNIQPKSITVKGPEKFIDSIEYISTIPYELVGVNKNFSQTVPLQIPKINSNKYSFETDNVKISGSVAKFTQGQIEIPITILSLPKNVQMELFPKTALIKYQVTFDNYQKITKNSFTVSCNYPTDNLSVNKTLRLQVDSKPSYITDFSIMPQQVTYLIKR